MMAATEAEDPRSEINRLWGEIEGWQSGELSPDPGSYGSSAAQDSQESTEALPMSTDPDSPGMRQPSSTSPRQPAASRPTVEEMCPDERDAPAADTCEDVCVLASSVCYNADRICVLASELSGDAWAQGKCTHARSACTEAAQRCCSCRRGGS